LPSELELKLIRLNKGLEEIKPLVDRWIIIEELTAHEEETKRLKVSLRKKKAN